MEANGIGAQTNDSHGSAHLYTGSKKLSLARVAKIFLLMPDLAWPLRPSQESKSSNAELPCVLSWGSGGLLENHLLYRSAADQRQLNSMLTIRRRVRNPLRRRFHTHI